MNCFFISKPIQYHNARQLQKQFEGNKHLVIFGHFFGSYEFFENVKKYDDVWDEVFYFSSRIKAYLFVFKAYNSSNIFLDSDYGKDYFIVKLIERKRNLISLFEEGLFSYECDLRKYYKSKFPIRSKIYDLLFLPKGLGGSKYIRDYYIYDLEKFNNKRDDISYKAKAISSGFTPNICDLSIYKKVFNFKISGSDEDVFIYAGSKYIEEIITIDELSEISKCSSLIFFKPHPGATYSTSKVIEKFTSLNVINLDNPIPIELALTLFGDSASITIAHHNSSIGDYLNASCYKVINLESC